MAEHPQKVEDDVTCSICVDMFHEPVSLPCNHSYCRECLQMFVAKSAPTKLAEKSEPTKKSKKKQRQKASENCKECVISCPMCRSAVNIGVNGVAGLPINAELAGTVQKLGGTKKCSKEKSQLCCMCEGEERNSAVKFCSTCSVLYCTECLAVLHPMRGPLKRHALISIEQYMAQGSAVDAERESKTSAAHPTCSRHGEAFSLFCQSCEHLVCPDCLDDHYGHAISNTRTACDKLKEPLLQKAEQCKVGENTLISCGSDTEALILKIQEQENYHLEDIEKKFANGLKYLESWRRKCTKAVTNQHQAWLQCCHAFVKDQSIQKQEVGRLIETSNSLVSGQGMLLLQASKQVTSGIDQQLALIPDTVNAHQKLKKDVEKKMKLVTLAALNIGEPFDVNTVSGPALKFRKLSNSKLMEIKEKGYEVARKGVFVGSCDAWTDGRIEFGRHYWEILVTVTRDHFKRPLEQCSTCTVGVVLEDATLAKNPGKTSWGLQIEYAQDEYRCSRAVGHGDLGPPFNKWIPYSGTHRLGFYIDSEFGTMKILDCTQGRLITTISDLDESTPLVPAIRFDLWYSLTALLVPVDCSKLSQTTQALMQQY